MRAEMVNVAGEVGAIRAKRLLNACMKQCNVPEDCETRLIVQRNNSAQSCYEISTIEDSGQVVAGEN